MNNEKTPLSSLIPILLLGAGAVAISYYMTPKTSAPPTSTPQHQEEPKSPEQSAPRMANDFEASQPHQAKKTGTGSIEIDSGRNIYVLSQRGGRIERVYVKRRDTVRIPQSVIEESKDPVALKYGALEITMGNGMDFQPHLYYSGEGAAQLGHPSLNDVEFSVEQSASGADVQEVRFTAPVSFKGHRLEIVKVYRFLKDESFFHQVTILRNLEAKPFSLGGDLFFKPFAGIGPAPLSDASRELTMFGRFINYDDSLKRLQAYGEGGSGFLGCGGGDKGAFTRYTDKPDTLSYLGAHSRYFIAYTRFFPSENKADLPDGAIVANNPSRKSDAFYTTFFRDLHLGAASKEELRLSEDPARSSGGSTNDLVKLDQKRGDALVINMQVYAGLRADDEHGFSDTGRAKGEFGEDAPLSGIRDVIYSSAPLALFSKVRDGIVLLMRFIYGFVGNYGLAILLIAFALKLVTYPLNQMQARSMKKMGALKPEIDAINAKYADDPNEKQKRTMEVYKKHKVNPATGCLPMLIQIPIFIALYSAFTESIELWHSPFFLWIKDLSEPDTIYTINYSIIHNVPINILPLLMVGSQFAQQKLTTVVADPQQRMLMYIMPFMMIFFFWSMPSGVTMYWTVQNIIAVLWQLAVNRFAKVED